MAHENPLITLGVTRAVIVRERALGDLDGILQVAEANYKALSKRYHPDNPASGDGDLMSMFTEAIEELRDLDALEVYVDELIGTEDIEGLYQREQSQRLVARDTAILSRLAGGFAYIDQFRVLGITGPTSYFADLQGQRIVVDVLAPTEARARVTDLHDETANPADFFDTELEVKYLRGGWQESYIDTSYRKHWTKFTRFFSDELVMLVGFVALDRQTDNPVAADSSAQTALNTMHQIKLDWLAPQDCWFLPELRFARDRPNKVGLVLYRPGNQGRFAVTDILIGSAPIKNR